MIGLITAERQLLRRRLLTVEYRGGSDRIVAGPQWGCRSRGLQFSFWLRGPLGGLGALQLRRPIRRAIKRRGLPRGVEVDVIEPPATRLLLPHWTVTVCFSMTAPWEEPLRTGREIWDATPMTIPELGGLIQRAARARIVV